MKGTNGDIPCLISEKILFWRADREPVPPTYFLLYTRNNSYSPHYLSDKNSFVTSNFNPNLRTVIILDGYQGSPNAEHIIYLKTAFLYYENCNVIIVDWTKGASAFIFPFAMRNTLIEGKYIAEQLELWKNYTDLDFRNVHIIGFSLGGQTAGFIGKYVKTGKIGRITGLDIVGACYVSFSSKYKLHYSDAMFVDVISVSSSFQLLIEQPTGHVFFRPDGGQIGRGCADRLVELNFWKLFGCTHMRTVYLFASTLYTKVLPVAYSCKDRTTFYRGKCSECGSDGKKCALMGIQAEKYADKIINGTIIMYLATTFTDEYFLNQYHVEIALGSGRNVTVQEGKLALIINSGRVNAVLNKDLFLQDTTEKFYPGTNYTYLFITTHNIDRITDLQFLWYSTVPSINNKLYVKCIKIVPMNNLERDRSNLTTYGITNGEAIPPHNVVNINLRRSC